MDDSTKEEQKTTQDVEKGVEEITLQRTLLGPPYSIFSPRMKIWIICLVSVSALISPFGATLFYPVLNVLSEQLNVTPAKTNISITTYMVRLRCLVTRWWRYTGANPDRLHKLLLPLSSLACPMLVVAGSLS